MKKILFVVVFMLGIIGASYGQTAPKFKEGDIVEIIINNEPVEGVIHQVGASGRCEVKYGTNGYTWVANKEIKATKKGNAKDEEAKKLASLGKVFKVGDKVWVGTASKGMKGKFFGVIEGQNLIENGTYSIKVTENPFYKASFKFKPEEILGAYSATDMKYKVGDKVSYGQSRRWTTATIKAIAEGSYDIDCADSFYGSTTVSEYQVMPLWDYPAFFAVANKLYDMANFAGGGFNFEWIGQLDNGEMKSVTVTDAQLIKILNESDAIEATLKAKFPAIPNSNKMYANPDYIMDLLKRKRAIFAEKMLESPAKKASEFMLGMLDNKIADLNAGKNNEHWVDDVMGAKNPRPNFDLQFAQLDKEQLAPLRSRYKILGVPAPEPDKEAIFKGMMAKSAEYEKGILSKNWFEDYTDTFTAKNAAIEGAAIAWVKANDPKVVISKTGVNSGGWQIFNSTEWINDGRSQTVMLWCTNPGYKYKYAYAVSVVQKNLNGGKWGKMETNGNSAYYFFYAK